MSIAVGIIGPGKSGKSTIFNALTGGKAEGGGLSVDGHTTHIGAARVPEPRLKTLADMLQPKKVVPAEVRYIDVGASVKSLVTGPGIGGELLNHLSNADALINVVRAFADDSVPHPEGSLDVERDIANMNLELVFSDLTIIERRLERIETSLKGAKPPERQAALHEQEIIQRLKAELEKDIPIRALSLAAADARLLAGFQFLTAKPLLTVVNIGEEQLPQVSDLETELSSRHKQEKSRIIALCGKLEMELGQLDEPAAAEFRADFGLTESGLDRVIQQSYELLGLVSFFSTAHEEVRAWSIPHGTSAVKAAGKIHSDMERGFIRAEVISYHDLMKCGSLSEGRKHGLLRLEGKEYIVQDGDVITFLFNV
ncbi:MAG: redox-regulated ATPase YchF [Chloroflexi bacterium]|nr:redox-regulated ATPase YchF [Chloroflexota bacterium]